LQGMGTVCMGRRHSLTNVVPGMGFAWAFTGGDVPHGGR
jgi:hypothetical protein